MQALHEKYTDQGVIVLAVSIDRAGIEGVNEYIEKAQLTFLNLHDKSQAVGAKYGVRGIPMTFILNKDGKAVATAIGPRPWDGEDVEKLVEHLLISSEKK